LVAEFERRGRFRYCPCLLQVQPDDRITVVYVGSTNRVPER
jgi:hypothetical protein